MERNIYSQESIYYVFVVVVVFNIYCRMKGVPTAGTYILLLTVYVLLTVCFFKHMVYSSNMDL